MFNFNIENVKRTEQYKITFEADQFTLLQIVNCLNASYSEAVRNVAKKFIDNPDIYIGK